MHLIIYGPEGSGKGTQAKLLGEYLHLPIYTAGDLVRNAAINDKGKLGIAAKLALTSGIYLSDKEMFSLLQKQIATSEAKKGFILDGFPRTKQQGESLLKEVNKFGFQINKLIYLKLSDREAKKRLIKRRRPIFPGSKLLHDTPERIGKRLETYRKLEKEVIKLFNTKGLLLIVNGNNTPEKVFKDIQKGLNLPQ